MNLGAETCDVCESGGEFLPCSHIYNPKDFDCLIKILVIGDAGVGKTCSLLRFIKLRTIEMNGQIIKLEIWDTSGGETFRALMSSLFRGTHGVVAMYDVTNQDSFTNLQENWMNQVHQNVCENLARLLVGNKCDMTEKKVVDYTTAKVYANTLGISFFETSAKTGVNIEQAFMTLVGDVVERMKKGLLPVYKPSIQINNHVSKNRLTSC